MPTITLTEANPVTTKASGGGGSQSATLIETTPLVVKASGGGGSRSALLTETSPIAIKAAGGGGHQEVILLDWPPALPKPTVSTDPPTGVGEDSATLNGYLDDDGGIPSNCAFVWGLSKGYGKVTPLQSKRAAERFSQLLTGLEPDTLYHFRALAINAFGQSYGSDRTFRTPGTAPPAYFQSTLSSLLEEDRT